MKVRLSGHRFKASMAGQENEADEIAQCVGQRQDFGRHTTFSLLRPVRGALYDGGVDHRV